MDSLDYSLEREVTIQAGVETIFRFFTDTERWARWWGAGSSIDARPGGHVVIRYPNGAEASGEVLEVAAPHRIAFTFGYASGTPIKPGSSRVTIYLEPTGDATRLRLTHEVHDAAIRDAHVQGWRYQLSLFANAVADEVHTGAEALVDSWFAAWGIASADERQQAFLQIADPRIRFHDRFSALEGIDELSAHAGASQAFMPGVVLSRRGPVRHCQGVLLAEWSASGPDGTPMMSGTNVYLMGPSGKILQVTGIPATA